MSHDLDGWPRSDANYILIAEIILMTLFLFFECFGQFTSAKK